MGTLDCKSAEVKVNANIPNYASVTRFQPVRLTSKREMQANVDVLIR